MVLKCEADMKEAAKRCSEVNPKIPNQLEENQKPFRDKEEGMPLSAFQRLGGSFVTDRLYGSGRANSTVFLFELPTNFC